MKLWVVCLRAWRVWIMQTTRLCITRRLTMFLKQSRQSSHYCLDKMVPDTARKNRAVFRQRKKVRGSNSAEEFVVAVRRREIVLTDDRWWCTHWLIDVIPNKHAMTVSESEKIQQQKSLGTRSKLKCVSDHSDNNIPLTLITNTNNVYLYISTALNRLVDSFDECMQLNQWNVYIMHHLLTISPSLSATYPTSQWTHLTIAFSDWLNI